MLDCLPGLMLVYVLCTCGLYGLSALSSRYVDAKFSLKDTPMVIIIFFSPYWIMMMSAFVVIELCMQEAHRHIPLATIYRRASPLERELLLQEHGLEDVVRAFHGVWSQLDQWDSEEYRLYRLRIDSDFYPFLAMRNPSTGQWHLEGVRADLRTVRDALAWRNGTEIPPSVLT